MGRPPLGKVAMSDSERHRRYMTRLRQRAAAATAASTTTLTPSAAPHDDVPSLKDGLHPEQTGTWVCERLIADGWSFDRIAAFAAAIIRTNARHREEAEGD